MTVVSVVCYKGGVGKSTVAVHLAEAARREGRRVLLIDLEPQASATEQIARRVDIDFDASDVLLRPDRADRALVTARPTTSGDEESSESEGHLDLLPASEGLLGTNAQLSATGDREALRKFLSEGIDPDRYDLVVVDTAGTPNALSICTLQAADLVVAPFTLESSSFKGLNRLNDVLDRLESAPQRLILPMKYHAARQQSKDALNALKRGYGDYPEGVVLSPVRINQGFPRAYEQGETIFDLTGSHRARKRGAEDYNALLNAVKEITSHV